MLVSGGFTAASVSVADREVSLVLMFASSIAYGAGLAAGYFEVLIKKNKEN